MGAQVLVLGFFDGFDFLMYDMAADATLARADTEAMR